MIPFLFAVHAHQPVGNFQWVFEKAYADCYDPFLTMLAEFPEIKATVHYSGCLLEWIEEHRPEHVERLRELVRAGQIELLGSGYYEPILPALPERDAKGQIVSYAGHLEALTGIRPRGIWLTERVWDPGLPKLLAECGVRYTLVDDSHFRFAGLQPDQAWGPWLTEREGHRVVIFPIDKQLRYLIPFGEPKAVIEHIKERAAKAPGFVACYGDDTEKFGVWPDTHEWVFEKGWLRSFFELLTEERDEIATMHYSEYLKTAAPRGRIYLPPASYDEMMEWALPPALGEGLEKFEAELKGGGRWAEVSPFVRGGHWDMFLSKYEESNLMHKRMLLASERIAALDQVPAEARAHLYRSQCNCAYWHGVFGGLYLNFLRHAVYQELLAAEALACPAQELTVESRDYDLDGRDEIIVRSPLINLFIQPHRGGAVSALEHPGKRFSLMNLMSRRRETYHHKLTDTKIETGADDSPKTIHDRVVMKEEGLEKYLVFDRFPRHSLQDHVTPLLLTLEEIETEQTLELGRFAGAPYELKKAGVEGVAMSRLDKVGEVPLLIEKTIRLDRKRGGFTAAYRLTHQGERPFHVRFGVEFNLTLISGDGDDRYCRIDGEKPEGPSMNGRGEHPEASQVELVNEFDGFAVSVKSSAPALVFRLPVQTVSQSESGFERTYQGSALWFTWPLKLGPGESWTVLLDLDLVDLG